MLVCLLLKAMNNFFNHFLLFLDNNELICFNLVGFDPIL